MTETNERILILAASYRDAESTRQILTNARVACLICPDVETLGAEINRGAGALILAKEVLTPYSVQSLSGLLSRQPPWSFLPVILLISAGDLALGSEKALKLLQPLRNTTLLERPVRIGTFVSVVQSALADRRRQYEVRDLLEALEKSKREAIEANQAKTAFLANMSHEIRTPLGAILGFSELLTESAIAEADKRSYLATIIRNGSILSTLVDDILDLAKVESGRIAVENIDVSVNELISEVVSALEPKASMKGLRLVVDIEPSVPALIRTDPVRFKQILINVIGNGIKFTKEGKIAIRLFTAARDAADKQLILYTEVTDTGLGISPSQSTNLFQAFTQADSSITRKFGGTGLGLALSKSLAQALGGDLILKQSLPDIGSTFAVTIDIGQPTTEPATSEFPSPRPAESDISTSLPLKDFKVLLVDDSKDNQILIGRMLKLAGAEVKTADDGLEAIQAALKNDFDLILMDVQMPRLGGREATLRLRQQGYTKPIVALTAHALKEDRERCLEAGCNGYLTKPIKRADLVSSLARYRSSGGSESAQHFRGDRSNPDMRPATSSKPS